MEGSSSQTATNPKKKPAKPRLGNAFEVSTKWRPTIPRDDDESVECEWPYCSTGWNITEYDVPKMLLDHFYEKHMAKARLESGEYICEWGTCFKVLSTLYDMDKHIKNHIMEAFQDSNCEGDTDDVEDDVYDQLLEHFKSQKLDTIKEVQKPQQSPKGKGKEVEKKPVLRRKRSAGLSLAEASSVLEDTGLRFVHELHNHEDDVGALMAYGIMRGNRARKDRT